MVTTQAVSVRWLVAVLAIAVVAVPPTLMDAAHAVPSASLAPAAISEPADPPAPLPDGDLVLPPGLESALARDTGQTPEEYLEEADAALEVSEAIEALQGEGIAIDGAVLDDGEATVYVDSSADAAAARAAGLAPIVGEAPTIDVSDVVFESMIDLSGGEPYGYSDGVASFRCSLGFPGVNTRTGAPQAITAGHCDGDLTRNRAIIGMEAPSDSAPLIAPIGPGVPGSYVAGSGWDHGLISVANSAITPRPEVLTWGGGSAAPRSSDPLAVRDAAALRTAGSTLCKSGGTTGWTCGRVLGFLDDQVVSGRAGDPAYVVDGILACIDIQPGDSGGAAVVGTTAVGVVSAAGQSDQNYCGTIPSSLGVIVPLYPSFSGGAAASTLYGSDWEPRIAISRPVIRVADGNVISGTVPSGRSRHRVVVTIDGDDVRTAPVANDGTWSIDVSDIGRGQHSYTAIARWGSRQRSSTTSGEWFTFRATRLAGQDRYATAAEISKAAFPDGAPIVFIASGANFPDALSAGPAAAHLGGPLLLTIPSVLPDVVKAELRRLKPERIVVVGGPSVVSSTIARTLRSYATTGSVVRLGGSDRYETSRLVADFAFDTSEVVYLATGANFPDALSAGSAGGAAGAPVILVPGLASSLDAPTRRLIQNLGAREVKVAGGPSVVSSGILRSADGLPGVRATRLSGPDRFATSLAVNDELYDSASEAFLAFGLNYPDALAGSVLAGIRGGPMYISTSGCVPPAIVEHLRELGVGRVTLFGSSAVLSTAIGQLRACR